jgi:hypothetical protein
VSATRKPSVAAATAAAAHGPPSPQRTLESLLELAAGSPRSARAVLDRALADAGRDELPVSARDVVAFVRAHVLGVLTEEIGPRLTMALVDDLVAQLQLEAGGVLGADSEPSIPPASVPRPVRPVGARLSRPVRRHVGPLRVALVDADRVGRTAVARALLRERWDVTVVDELAAVGPAMEAVTAFDAVLVDTLHPAALAIVEALLRASPGAAVVVRSADTSRDRAMVAGIGVGRFELRSSEAPAEELVEAVKRAMAE